MKEFCNGIICNCNNINSNFLLLLSFLPLDAIESGLLIEVLKELHIRKGKGRPITGHERPRGGVEV
jgi:hypothetical protein